LAKAEKIAKEQNTTTDEIIKKKRVEILQKDKIEKRIERQANEITKQPRKRRELTIFDDDWGREPEMNLEPQYPRTEDKVLEHELYASVGMNAIRKKLSVKGSGFMPRFLNIALNNTRSL